MIEAIFKQVAGLDVHLSNIVVTTKEQRPTMNIVKVRIV